MEEEELEKTTREGKRIPQRLGEKITNVVLELEEMAPKTSNITLGIAAGFLSSVFNPFYLSKSYKGREEGEARISPGSYFYHAEFYSYVAGMAFWGERILLHPERLSSYIPVATNAVIGIVRHRIRNRKKKSLLVERIEEASKLESSF